MTPEPRPYVAVDILTTEIFMNVFIRLRTNRRRVSGFSIVVLVLLASILFAPSIARAQGALETPLRQELLTLLTNEISGQVAFNNVVKLAGAPWLRDRAEFSSTFYEAEVLYDLVRGYGIETVSLDQFPREETFSYATEGEFWIVEPEPRLVASLGADVAMIASGSQSGEVTGELIYVPQLSAQAIQRMSEGHGSFEGKVALMWSHPRVLGPESGGLLPWRIRLWREPPHGDDSILAPVVGTAGGRGAQFGLGGSTASAHRGVPRPI
jgi:hypothetical protein